MDNIITCKICGFSGKSLTTHIKYKHQLDGKTYKQLYGGCLAVMSDAQKKVLSDLNKEKAKNPDYLKMMSNVQKNGGSIYTKKYWTNKGLSEEEAVMRVSQIQANNAKKSVDKGDWKNRSWMFVDYWMNRGYTEQEARENISKRQMDLSSRSSKFSGCVRTEESKKKYLDL